MKSMTMIIWLWLFSIDTQLPIQIAGYIRVILSRRYKNYSNFYNYYYKIKSLINALGTILVPNNYSLFNRIKDVQIGMIWEIDYLIFTNIYSNIYQLLKNIIYLYCSFCIHLALRITVLFIFLTLILHVYDWNKM